MNMNSYSRYEEHHNHRFCALGGGDNRHPTGRAAGVAPAKRGGDCPVICFQFCADGRIGEANLQPGGSGQRILAASGDASRASYARAGSVFERVFYHRVSECRSGGSGPIRRVDADLLCRGSGWGVGQSVSVVSGPPVLKTKEPWRDAPRQARSIAARKELLLAGRLLFGEKGFEATSIAEIAAKAGMAVGSFYLYFGSKRQLLVALMNELLERLASANLRPEAGGDMQRGLHHFLAAVFRVDLDYFGVVRAWQEASLTDAGLGRMQVAIQTWTEGRILRVFQLLQAHPNARPGRDLPTFARMMDRHFWSLLARAGRLPRKQFDREVRIAADVIYHYLFSDPVASGNS